MEVSFPKNDQNRGSKVGPMLAKLETTSFAENVSPHDLPMSQSSQLSERKLVFTIWNITIPNDVIHFKSLVVLLRTQNFQVSSRFDSTLRPLVTSTSATSDHLSSLLGMVRIDLLETSRLELFIATHVSSLKHRDGNLIFHFRKFSGLVLLTT